MAVRKRSVAIDLEVADAAAEADRRAGVSFSAWLTRAARRELAVERGLAAVREWEKEHGAMTADELADADRVLDRWFAPRP